MKIIYFDNREIIFIKRTFKYWARVGYKRIIGEIIILLPIYTIRIRGL